MKRFKIFDAHLHTHGSFLNPDLDLLTYLDQYNIEKAIITTVNEAASFKIITSKEMEGQNKGNKEDIVYKAFETLKQVMSKGQLDHSDVKEIANKSPERFFKFFWFNPKVNPESIQESYKILEKHFDEGFCGVKLNSGIHLVEIPDDVLELVEFMQEYNKLFPLYIHLTPKVTYFKGISRKDIIKLAELFPELIIIVGHAGFAMEYAVELGLTLKKYQNVYFETSCSIPYGILVLIKMIGHSRILFGSDAPITNPIQIEIDKILSLPITDKQKQDIFYNNAKQLFNVNI
jgi:predicted TIM-barrel fold metal-dependent hydrolase